MVKLYSDSSYKQIQISALSGKTYCIRHSCLFVGDNDDSQFTRPRDLDLIQSTPLESTLSLKTPPRVLTLTERPFDFLEMEQPSSISQPSEDVSGLDQI